MNTPNADLAQRVVRHAARRAPPGLTERLEEEWLADLQTRRGAVSRLRFAAGCCWATRVIAHEFASSRVLATSGATTATGSIASHSDPALLSFSRRSFTVFLIVALHVALIYVFASGLGKQVLRLIPPDVTGRFIEERTHPEAPKLPPPDLRQWTDLKLPQPDVTFRSEGGEDSISAPPAARAEVDEGPAPVPTHEAKRLSGGPAAGFPNTDDFYPADLIRRGEKGLVVVRSCVDQRGRLTSPPTVAQTSGSPGIDHAALKLAQAGSGHYRPTTEEGQPISSCFEFRIRFDLH